MRKALTESLKQHPSAEMVPEMRPAEWSDFYADIAFRGIKVPLEVLGDGTVIDGRHRLKAALELNLLEVPIVDAPLNGDDPTAYMLKAAVLRRHLTDDQRALMAAMWAQENKRQGERVDLTSGERQPEVDGHPRRQQAAADFKVSPTKIKHATTVLHADKELAKKVHSGEIALKNAHRTVKKTEERQRIEATAPPVGEYQVLVVDPPWPYTVRQSDPSHRGSGIEPYEAMSLDDIKAMSIPATNDAALWLWTTNAFLHDAFHVLEAWGFTYRTTLTWIKNIPGLGDWLAGQTEHCLLATRGEYSIFRDAQSTALHADRGRHSVKPDEFYTLVEGLCPGEKIDMFARKPREGWMTWGAEA